MSNVVAIRMPEKLKNKIEQIADRELRTFANQVQFMCEEWFKNQEPLSFEQIDKRYNQMLLARFRADKGRDPSRNAKDPAEAYLATIIACDNLKKENKKI